MRRPGDVRNVPHLCRRQGPRHSAANVGRRGRDARGHRIRTKANQPAVMPARGRRRPGWHRRLPAGRAGVVSARRVVVVGAGHGGFNVCAALRTMGWDGELTLVDSDHMLPYQRPPLSKKFLAGEETLADTYFRPRTFYDDHDIGLVLGHRVVGIDRRARTLQLEGRAPLAYDHLVLATGARPRPLPIAGVGPESVCYLHTADHSVKLRERMGAGERVVIIGGGFIGLEAASMAAHAGKEVIVLEV